MARSLIDETALNSRLQEQVANYGSVKDFHIMLWRQERAAGECNWNAHIRCIRGRGLSDSRWWDVVPKLRKRFDLR